MSIVQSYQSLLLLKVSDTRRVPARRRWFVADQTRLCVNIYIHIYVFKYIRSSLLANFILPLFHRVHSRIQSLLLRLLHSIPGVFRPHFSNCRLLFKIPAERANHVKYFKLILAFYPRKTLVFCTCKYLPSTLLNPKVFDLYMCEEDI
jgi:hypothetical protein